MTASRIAIFSDVHGNVPALEAVLADAAAAGVTEFWIVGDHAANGPRPAEVLRRLTGLPSTKIIRGNTDRYVATGDHPRVAGSVETVRTPEEIGVLLRTVAAISWTRGVITEAGFLPWLSSLPLDARTTLPDGTRVLLVHAASGTDDGSGIDPTLTDDGIRSAITGAEAELIFVGHTHKPLDRTVDGIRVINSGSVSLPATAERRACWTLLTADEHGHTAEPRRVDYDLDEVLADLHRVAHPSAVWLQQKFRSQPAR
ncbi:metallophosphoesterase family protein [Microlunatus parietis]|uniref:Putative phosphodiesterase n=1 Tax=Microlunatus parietis TaxID=682979 RepID=A0A7Y9I9S7_9ACTN|nr:metallophosphoesterase family protein [Microlunatus parietis]NYE72948.1 putative phosphodiesterase [Microlunatus parietis]